MTKTKWIRRALLGGAAVAVMATGAQADDLSALKAQIEALQARVNTIESRGAALPEGVSLLTVARGQSEIKMVNEAASLIDTAPEGRGLTISVTPTADLPAPATEITISGYVRALAIISSVKGSAVTNDKDFDVAARGQVDLRSKTDTAVGQVRTHIQFRADFGTDLKRDDKKKGDGKYEHFHDADAKVRIAVGEWDFMPNWTLKAGHTGQIAALTNVGFAGVNTPYGIDSSRHSQIGLHYNGGPVSFGFGVEEPAYDEDRTVTMPDFAGYAQFSPMGGMSLRVTGEVGKVYRGSSTSTKTGYQLGVGAAFKAAMVGLNVGFAYSKGRMQSHLVNGTTNNLNAAGNLAKAWGLQGNATFGLNDATTLYAGGGYYNYTSTMGNDVYDHGYSVQGGVAWRPVTALQVALEGAYYYDKQTDGDKRKKFVGAVGFWFFF